MVSKYFLDSDVILDLMMDREPFSIQAKIIFQLSRAGQISLFCSLIIVTNIFYIVNKTSGKQKAIESLVILLDFCRILPVGENEIRKAFTGEFSDFEDGIQHEVALSHPGIKAIITRNKKDYIFSKIPVFDPQEFLALFK